MYKQYLQTIKKSFNMKSIYVFMLLSIFVVALACNETPVKVENTTILPQESIVEKGKYLATISGCIHCHTPKIMTPMGPVPDTSRLLSGYRSGVEISPISKDAFSKGWLLYNMEGTVLSTPMFTSFSANITSDETGIGNWTYENFKTALTKGKLKGIPTGRDLLPPMPWQDLAHLKEDDIQALFAFLKSTKPVKNLVPPAIINNQMK